MKIGVIGIIVKTGPDCGIALCVQRLLSDFCDIIIGRMGVPDRESGISAISVIVKGPMERISALTGKLGRIDGVLVKSATVSDS